MSLAASTPAIGTHDDFAIADGEHEISWRELDRIINQATNGLLAADLGAAKRIAVFAPNSAYSAMVYLAGLHAGVSSVPVNFHLTVDELSYILADSDAGALFVSAETAATGLEAAKRAGVKLVIGQDCSGIAGIENWDAWLARQSSAEPPVDQPMRPYLHYTSGTTGRPRGTETPPNMLPHTPTVSSLFEKLREIAAEGAQGPHMLVGPLYHTGPLLSIRSLAAGVPLVVLRRFEAETLLSLIDRYKAVSTVMVPTHFKRLLQLPDAVRTKYDISSMEMLGHTGAACPAEVKRAMIEWFGPVLVEAYGATESGTTNRITSQEWLQKPGSVGLTQPPFELLIVGDDGEFLGSGEIGQIYFRDTTGYGIAFHNDPEKTRAAHLEPGVFTLGDVGYCDADGFLFVTDRVSDMIVSGGVNIYPAEIEQVLIEHPAVEDVAVIGVPDEEMGEQAKALIVPVNREKMPSASELAGFCRGRLAGYKCPRSFDMVDDIGRNAMGKVNKRTLRAPFWPEGRSIGG